MSNMLGRIKSGKQDAKPVRLMVYGKAGVGKSSFASTWPKPLFIDAEKRTEHLDVDRIEVGGWAEVLGAMRELCADKEHGFETAVFDTVDHLELMVFDYVCKQSNANSIDEVGGGYGQGYSKARDEWRRFVKGLEKMRDAGIQCILLAHGHVKTFRNPEGEDFDRWELKMNAKSASFLREVMDVVAFARFEDFTAEDKGTKKHKAKTTGDRILSMAHSPAYESKRGIPIAEECPLSYEGFQEALKEGE